MNNMKKTVGVLIALFLMGTGFAQDQKAKAILDKVSSKTNAYKNLSINFSLTISGDMDPITQKGKAIIEGEKYKVELEDQDIYCDGTTITTHLKDDQECYTSSVADATEEGSISPSKLLTIWEDGYKYKYIKETEVNGTIAHQINLFPKDAANSKFHTIILKIDKEKNEVLTVYIKGKDGTNMKYTLTKLDKNLTIPVSTFTFDRAKNPNVQCYDE
jgi:outer membrane lipoprotein-sorting protein